MSETVPTMLVKDKKTNHVFVTNVSDFNPDTHEAVVSGSETKAPAFDRKAAQEFLDSKGVKYAKNASNDTLAELMAAANGPSLSVAAKDGKFIIVNAAGEQQGVDAYETKDDADLMLSMLLGKA